MLQKVAPYSVNGSSVNASRASESDPLSKRMFFWPHDVGKKGFTPDHSVRNCAILLLVQDEVTLL